MAGNRIRAAGRQVLAAIQPGHCALCRREINERRDKLLFGPTERAKNFSVHYFCMLFSSNLIQEGEEDQGIKGFLERSIIGEIGRGSSFLCSFCRKPGATIGCVVGKCRKTVHFPCGLENDVIYDFASPSFETLCPVHNPLPEDVVRDEDSKCSICIGGFKRLPRFAYRPITCPTCQNSFHMNCLRRTAVKSGIHHYRCPFCRDDDTFVVHCQKNGIYVPDQDAAWELDDAFNDHYEVLHTCDAFQCLCPGGRLVDDGDWDVVSCSTCGLNGTHVRCRNLGEEEIYICSVCTPMPPNPREGEPKRSLNEWFYSKSRFHFREPKEVIQLLKKGSDDDDVYIDIDSEGEDVNRMPVVETDPDSPRESSLELVLEESDERSPRREEIRVHSPSTWRDFHVRFTEDDCELMANHIPCLPTRFRTQPPQKMDGEPSCSSQNRPPLSQLQDSYAETIVSKQPSDEDESSNDTEIIQESNIFDCVPTM